jgi:hypothetical protein
MPSSFLPALLSQPVISISRVMTWLKKAVETIVIRLPGFREELE